MTTDQYNTILKGISGIGAMLTHQAEEIEKLRDDVQQTKTSQRAGKKRDWRIIKMIKGGR